MDLSGTASRFIAKAKFKMLGHATIIDITTERFEELKLELESEGWRPSIFFRTFPDFINHDDTTLWKKTRKIKLEWDNWTEGSIEGSKKVIKEIAERDASLKVVDYWRWSIYD